MAEITRREAVFELILEDEKFENKLDEIKKDSKSTGQKLGKDISDGAKEGGKGIDKLSKKSSGLKSVFGGAASAFKKIFAVAVIAKAIQGLSSLVKSSVNLADVQLKSEQKIRQSIVSTNNAAKLSFRELTEEASRLQEETLFGDEQILNGVTAQLLTFTNIAGDNFKRTQQVALDLATVLDGDLQSASIQLGKALNDPVANLSALSRSGIQFSAGQKAVIKDLAQTNRLSEAQSVILKELERQYGGQAKAAAEAGAGPLTQYRNALGDLQEQIGKRVLPLINGLANAFKGVVNRVADFIRESKAITGVINFIGRSVTVLVRPFGLLVGTVGKLFTVLSKTFVGRAIIGGIGKVAEGISILPAIFNGVVEVVKLAGENIAKFFEVIAIDAQLTYQRIKDFVGLGNQEVIDQLEKDRASIERSGSLFDAFKKGFDEIQNLSFELPNPDTPENLTKMEEGGGELGAALGKGIKEKLDETLIEEEEEITENVLSVLGSAISDASDQLANQIAIGDDVGAIITADLIMGLEKQKAAIEDAVVSALIPRNTVGFDKIGLTIQSAIPDPQSLRIKAPERSGSEPSFLEKLLGLDKEGIEKLKQGLVDAFNFAKQAFNDFADNEIAKNDTLIDSQQKRVDKAKELSEKGRDDLLEIETQKLDKLNEERQRFVDAQIALDKIEILSTNLLALSKAKLAVTNAVASAPFPFNIPAVVFATAGLAANLASAVSTVSSFKDGVDYLEGPGTTTSDSIPARLSKGEGVVKASTNAKRLKAGLDNETLDTLSSQMLRMGYTANDLQELARMRPAGHQLTDLSSGVRASLNAQAYQKQTMQLDRLNGQIAGLRRDLNNTMRNRKPDVHLDGRKVGQAINKYERNRQHQKNLN